jgi:hypothetical protein
MTADTVLHVVFSQCAAETLKETLALAGRNEPVIGLHEDFSYGPIASNDPGDRDQWIETGLGYPGWEHEVGESAPFLTAPRFLATSQSASRLNAWFSMREAGTYANYLWWLSSMGDIAGVVTHVPGLSLSAPEELIPWLDRAAPLTAQELNHRRQQWRVLQSENSDLRITTGVDLVSKPLDFFDDVLLGLATDQWQRMARIVGAALCALSEDELYQVGDWILGARLASLAEAGVLEWRGNVRKMRECELRLPS